MMRGRFPSPRTLLSAFAFLAMLWLTGFLTFVAAMPSRVEDEDTRTDAIVVLTGGAERMNTGLTLLDRDMADRLFVSGVHKGVETADILRIAHFADSPRHLASRIDLGHSADDTVGNAEETRAWVEANGIKTLRLVTASYHMRRSIWEFQRVMPQATIIPNPVFPERARTGQGGYVMLLAEEYSKFTIAVFRNAIIKGVPS